MDEAILKAKREAAMNPEAAEKLRRLEARRGHGRHASHLQTWVVLDGVRNSYRGFLMDIVEVSDGGILRLHPCYALEALADTNNEVKLNSSEEHPWNVYSAAILSLGQQPEGWAKE